MSSEIGKKYGLLTITSQFTTLVKNGKDRVHYYPAYWCQCECGKVVTRLIKQLKNKNKMHCGEFICKQFVMDNGLRSEKTKR